MKRRYIIFSLVLALALPLWGMPAEGNVATAFEEAASAASQTGAKAVSGGIEVFNHSGSEIVAEVYSITGTMIVRLDVGAGDALRVELNAGVYIVRVDNHAARLLVR